MAATLTTVFLARHCDVENPRGIIYGFIPGTRLSALGRQQAAALGRYLAPYGVTHLSSSPLERALETSDLLCAELPDPPERDIDDRLVEATYGKTLEGVKRWQIPLRRPSWFVHILAPGLLASDEGVHGMASRIRSVVTDTATRYPGETTVLVSHGDPIQAFWIEWSHRSDYALHLLSCAKGGALKLTLEGTEVIAIEYLSPSRIRTESHGS